MTANMYAIKKDFIQHIFCAKKFAEIILQTIAECLSFVCIYFHFPSSLLRRTSLSDEYQ